MNIIDVNLKEQSRSYPIYIGNDILKKIGWYVKNKIKLKGKVVIITNPKVGNLYLEKCKKSFLDSGFETQSILVPDGEKFKNINEALKIFKKLLEFKADREIILVALGGGVIGDLTGFIAATYLRGVALIQVPTTLLAQVDSSVGGKVAINLPEGKNLVGAFYQPRMVFIDSLVLKTLDIREIRAGMAEVIKYGIIKDEKFLNFIEKNIKKILLLDNRVLEHIIFTSCKIKAGVVERDEKESGERAILNFGHTFGHAIETETNYKKYIHGEAVSIGMLAAMKLSEECKLINKAETERLKNVLINVGLPIKIDKSLDAERLLETMKLDKKVSQNSIRFVLTKKIGHVIIKTLNNHEQLLSILNGMKI